MTGLGNRLTENISPLLLGVLAFFIIVGPRALDPTNIAWLGQGDPATNYLGWLFFRKSDWSFPIGLNPIYGLEISNAILFSDSNPLLAFLFKPFAPLLPEPFQYFGIWLLVCFVVQAWIGWMLVGLLSDSLAIRVLAAGLFVFAPPMIWRLKGHFNLAGHFLILAALYLAFHPKLERRRLAWGTILAVASLVHAYLLAMVALLWLADFVGKTIQRRLTIRKGFLELTVMFSLIGIACWQAGYFSVGAGARSYGFGLYRMNMLAIFDASGWSHVLKDVPEADGDYEGFNFLGLGVIFLLVCVLPIVLADSTGLRGAIRRFPFLLVVLAGLTVFAISYKVGFGSLSFEYPLPHKAVVLANIFRGSGRMFWPVFYAIVFVVIFLIVRGNDKRTAIYLLGVALLIQIADTSAGWKGIHEKLMTEPRSTWVTPLIDPFWEDAASKYKKVRWIQPRSESPKWLPLAAYAATHGLATDAVYLARVDPLALEQAQRKASDALRTGTYEADSLYVLDNSVLRQAAFSVHPLTDVLARVDGLNVLAPGWKKCAVCHPVADEVKLSDLVPPLNVGERVLSSQTGVGVAYLSSGWSSPETWGTWSDGESAEIILPVSGKVSSILIEGSALVTPAHPKQDVIVKVNDALVFRTSLTKPVENFVDISIPETIRDKILDLGLMRVQLQFPNAVSPKEIRINEDGRKLALGLQAITVR